MKTWLLIIASVFATSAHAVPMTYDFTVGGTWSSGGAPVFGLSGQPTLSGQVTVDNSLSGLAAFQDFRFTTGSHTWTLSHFVGSNAQAVFSTSGDLVQFSLANFAFGGAQMYFYSNNTTNIWSGTNYFYCNSCISMGPGVRLVSVPEPSSIAMLLVGAGLFGLRRRFARA